MELLIAREGLFLKDGGGKSFAYDVPEFLRSPLCVRYTSSARNYGLDDFLVMDDFDITNLDRSLVFWESDGRTGLWSGYRSALVRDISTRDLYRLKGVALNIHFPKPMTEKGNVRIWGGQKKINAVYESRMLKRFNRTLEHAGIEPVAEPKGVWKYPNLCKGLRPVASIFKVKGDTRLDELVTVIEGLAINKCDVRKASVKINGEAYFIYKNMNSDGKQFLEYASMLLHDIGFVVGRLKNLMDVSGQTWGCNDGSTNAHWGNIVLYRDDNKLKVNLVDFDMSYGSDECSESEMEDMCKKEMKDLQSSFAGGTISLRKISGKPFRSKYGSLPFKILRDSLSKGFYCGYLECNMQRISNELEISRLDEVFSLLRKEGSFSDKKPRSRRVH
ncbi:MAG: hypothetical protein ABIH53_01895 [archaeon]